MMKQLLYVGHVIGHAEINPNPARVEAIKAFITPKTPAELQRFLRMVTSLFKFYSNLSATTAHLRELLRKDAEWLWMPSYEETFEKLKRTISENASLKLFDPKKPVKLSVDASSY